MEGKTGTEDVSNGEDGLVEHLVVFEGLRDVLRDTDIRTCTFMRNQHRSTSRAKTTTTTQTIVRSPRTERILSKAVWISATVSAAAIRGNDVTKPFT